MDGRPAGSSSGPAASAAAPERGHGRSVGADETSTAPTGPTVSARGEATSMWVTAGTVEDSTVGGPGGISSRSAVGTPECSADGVSTIRPTGSVGCRPCFAIRARTVLRVIPRIAAVREMFHPVRPSTSLRRWRSQAATSPAGTSADGVSANASKDKSAGGITAVGHMITARSMTLLSSRTLPGQ